MFASGLGQAGQKGSPLSVVFSRAERPGLGSARVLCPSLLCGLSCLLSGRCRVKLLLRISSQVPIPVIHPACWNFFLSVLVLLEFNQETEVSLFPICLMEALWAPDY